MASIVEIGDFFKCSCGTFFATLMAAMHHKCKENSDKDTDIVIENNDGNNNVMYQCDECQGCFNDMKVFENHECNATPKPSTRNSLEVTEREDDEKVNRSTSGLLWNRAATLLLIDLYKIYVPTVNQGKLRKKIMWDRISSDLASHGHNFTADQVSGRWKSILRGYKNVKDSNKKSGSGNKKYEYESELDDVLENDPVISPKFTISSSQPQPTDNTTSSLETLPSTSSGGTKTNPSVQDESPCSSDGPATKKRKTSSSSANSEMVDVFKSNIEDQKVEWKRREDMHKERIGMMSSLVNVLKGFSEKK